jgi:hypothetical protein
MNTKFRAAVSTALPFIPAAIDSAEYLGNEITGKGNEYSY